MKRKKFISLMVITKIIQVVVILLFFSCGKKQVNKKLSTKEIETLEIQRKKLEEKETKLLDSLGSIKSEISKINLKLRGQEVKYTLVSCEKLKLKNFDHYISLSGSVTTDNNININPEASGIIENIYVYEGQKVKKGQILCRINSDILNKTIKEAQSSFELSDKLYIKQKNLWDEKVGSEIQYLNAKNNRDGAKARLESLISQKNKLKVKAPFGGVIDVIYAKKGELSSPQSPILRLVNLNNMYSEIYVSEKYILNIKKGSEVILNFKDIGKKIKTEVFQVSNIIDPSNRSFRVRINIPEGEDIKPNQTVYASIRDYNKTNVTVISSKIINSDIEGNKYLYVLDKDKGIASVTKKNIEEIKSYKGESYIKGDLSPESIIVTKGIEGIKDGQKVKIYE